MLDRSGGCGRECGCPRKVQGFCEGCQGCGCFGDMKTLDLADITEDEQYFINLLEEMCYLPIGEISGIAVMPIFVTNEHQTAEETLQIAKVLTSLKRKGILSLDYEIPLANYDYENEFAIECFRESMNDTYLTVSRQGSMALTPEFLTLIDNN